MFRSLLGKLTAALVGLLALIGVLLVALILYVNRMHLLEVNQGVHEGLAERLVAEQILLEDGEVKQDALKELFHVMMVINPAIELYLLDPDGEILAYSAPPGKVKQQTVTMAPVRRLLAGESRYPVLGDDPRNPERAKAFSVAPIEHDGRREGYLYVVLGGEQYDSAVQMLRGSYILRFAIVTLVAGLVFAVLAGFVLFRVLTRRLRVLAASMQAFQDSDFAMPDVRLPGFRGVRGDEIDRLGATFERMTGRMHDQVEALKAADSSRRELVAAVSHDLRTPLSSLQGYLETLRLREGRLTPEESRSYLEIASRQGERLAKLVEDLFELAKLDSAVTRPQREPFSITELAQDVVQKFELRAQEKEIRLGARLDERLPFVSADIALIERVLENMIDNALKHTPRGGRIEVALRHDSGAVVVEIADTGTGIPAEELPHVFERFYRVNGEAREDGAGLGLAIAKKIIDLHQSTIEAISTVGSGTTFRFQLPIHQT